MGRRGHSRGLEVVGLCPERLGTSVLEEHVGSLHPFSLSVSLTDI